MPYAADDCGRLVFFISSMAMHTQKLCADGRASLLITEPGISRDPLGAARLTVGTTNPNLFEMMDLTSLSAPMRTLPTMFAVFRSVFRSRAALELENVALRH
jgi:hypothetical protein